MLDIMKRVAYLSCNALYLCSFVNIFKENAYFITHYIRYQRIFWDIWCKKIVP